ncbi:DNA polymerase III subunit beta [Viridibacillus sp. FSL R5-0477]|jgi:DNA polymerase-3 subunit beta|uniref:Beta sliding clamp n=2 Tax=Viridibacillus TaxID=496496 RepID=W4F6L3_9BACL|nr:MULTISPECIES: DNA polymerase III subunit beta [Viridibacillus]ETT88518.1 DNA polymerase III subunit beta [Viridibacillus arenosi FSL R5-213]KOO48275.1 DNA polymerase III subunit beta [Viridibacillus arvi]OMC81077.1 DNA polymerase III subunit beta [Viridibacillus sp. FSL H8-0123]OMC85171.1 DNA polymerase III subunit beta [Viridibacillus sp. FSL H7-0596]OMC90138.1 DNA polymerase III subunit beta [Viridibacillus arenosi]
MKFDIMRDRLLDGLNDVMKAVSSKTTIPILTGIKIDVSEEGMRLTGSDADITIQTYIPVEENGEQLINVEKPGSIVLQAKMFNEIVRKLPTNDVEFEVSEKFQTRIRSGKSDFHLIGLDSTEYPLLPELSEDNQFTVPADLLKSIIRETVFAVSTSESRPVLTGVHWQIKDGELVCVATDSHRLARRKVTLEHLPSEQSSVVVPGKSLTELSKILNDATTPVDIVMTNQQVLFKTNDVLFFSRLLEGNYPDTSRLIPEEYKTDVTVNGRSLLQAIDRASLLAREDRNNVVRFTTMQDDTIEISSNSPEVGKVEEQIQVSSLVGEELKISFSAKYMMDALKAIDGQDVVIQFTGAMRPFIIRSVHDDAILQLILPVRTY